ncbi:MAG: type II toxin-antitoxin system VapC family toxin [Acidobacteriota bacterium]|nr:type II toxin-antitoxin system VapC family toxin [Acidobacteriota bacterium]
MNGNKSALDSNLIILASKQQIDTEKLLSLYDEFYISIVTYMEVYAYDFQNRDEKDLTDELFANLEIVEVNRAIADQAIIYRKNKVKKIKLPDAIILATAKYLNADLLTENWKDFQTIDNFVNVLNLDTLKI